MLSDPRAVDYSAGTMHDLRWYPTFAVWRSLSSRTGRWVEVLAIKSISVFVVDLPKGDVDPGGIGLWLDGKLIYAPSRSEQVESFLRRHTISSI